MRVLLLLTMALAVAAFAVFAPSAWADDEEPENDISKEIKEQMDKILKLMKSNQDALTELSTGGAATPKRVDVEVPPSPPEGTSTEGTTAPENDAGASGRKAAEEIEKLLGSQQQGSKEIPVEIEQLLKMIPT